MKTIKLDPVTRLEGHMKIEVEIDDNKKVISAKSTGNMFRGFENLLKGRDPRDAIHITQRICGLCPVSHGIAAVNAIEFTIPNYKLDSQARLLRNLIQGANYLSDHILHFYHLTLLDYIKGPEKSPWSTNYNTDMRFSKSASDALFNNYIKALEIRRKAHEMVSIFAGKIPHVMSIVHGGVTKTPTREDISRYKTLLSEVRSFIDKEYYEDTQKIASVYKDYFNIGKGYGNFISFGVFNADEGDAIKTVYKSGRYIDGKYLDVDYKKITEDIKYSWYDGEDGLNIINGETKANLRKKNAYSWIKAPRYEEQPYEAGPLARGWINGDYRKGISVMDRHIARMLETKKIANAASIWIDQIIPEQTNYEPKAHILLRNGEGIGFTEAPRGALVHYTEYSNDMIDNYQIITPTCWNASPKDSKEQMGPLEMALIGVTIQDVNNPIELMRIVHSFDPCTACAVHIITPDKKINNRFIIKRGL